MLNKKILLSILSIGMLAVAASAGTYAWFSDAATTGENSVQAGTLKLNVADINGVGLNLGTGLAQPGDTEKSLGSFEVKNVGNLNGKISATISDVSGTGMTEHMIIYVNDQVIYNRGTTSTLDLGNLDANSPGTISVKYTFADKDTADQNDAKDNQFKFKLNIALNQA